MSTPRKNPRSRDAIPIVAASVLLAANAGLFGVFEIYLPNRHELDATFTEVLPALAVFTLVVALFVAALGIALPPRGRRTYAGVVLALGVALWVQGSFLRWGYGELDGRGIDWDRFTWQGWVDGAVWVCLIAAAVALRKRLFRHIAFVAVAFLVLQSAFAVVRAIRYEGPPARKMAEDDVVPEALCGVSKTRNIFHIIMDSFQTDVFLEIVEEDGLADELAGFTIFRDNLSTGRRTVLCVPAIMSGDVYDGSQLESEYFRDAVKRSFHNVLFENGYVVNLIPHITMENTRYTNYFTAPSTYAVPRVVRLARTAGFLVDVSLFRQVPHVFKKFIYNDENWRLGGVVAEPPSQPSFYQKAFVRDYTQRLEAVHPGPAYHFIHVMPPHPPLVTLADGSFAGSTLPNSRGNYKNEARYILREFMGLLERLKGMGLYDSSIIIIQGDHGAGFLPHYEGRQATAHQSGRVSALLAFKPAAAEGPMTVSDAQATIADIPATVMDLLGIEHSYPGDDLFQLPADRERDRPVVLVTERASSSPVLHRWRVRGSVIDTTSWHPLEPVIVERRPHAYRWGDKVGFGITGEGERYLTSGWSTTSPTLHWNDGDTAELTFAVEPPPQDVQVRFVFFPYIVPGKVPQQRIRLHINGYDVGGVTCTEKRSLNLDISVEKEVLQDGKMLITFDFLDAVSPASIGAGRDPRRMAMGLYGFETKFIDE